MFNNPTIIVLLTIAVLCVVVVLVSPRGFTGLWARLSETFETGRRAKTYSLLNQSLYVKTHFWRWLFDQYFVGEFAYFDIELDDSGMWLLSRGPEPRKCAESMLIPWNRVGFLKHEGDRSHLRILAGKPVEMTAARQLGELIAARAEQM